MLLFLIKINKNLKTLPKKKFERVFNYKIDHFKFLQQP